MKKLILMAAVLMFGSMAMVGCKASGEIDPDGRVSYNMPSIR